MKHLIDRWAWLAAVPCGAAAVAVALEGGAVRSIVSTPRLFAVVWSSAILLEAMGLVVAAPIAGAAIAARWGHARGAWLALSASVAVALLVSLALGAVAVSAGAIDLAVLLRSHATLGAAALALGSLGVLCGTVFRDVLDAAAVAVILSIVVSAGLLVAGPAVADAPQPVIDAGLAASPLVATASAAGVDIIRGEVLYRLSPIAHRRFEYPAWHVATVAYLIAAGLFALGAFSAPSRVRRA